MRRPALLVSLFCLSLAACGDDSAKSGGGTPASAPTGTPAAAPAAAASPTLEGAAGARAVVEAYFAAAKAKDEAAMLALGTAEWQTKEKTEKRRFTPAIAKGDITVKTYEVREPDVKGDSATVSVRAVFTDAKGKDDNEGMHFGLSRKDGRWWIVSLG